jgi:hypothetical protein
VTQLDFGFTSEPVAHGARTFGSALTVSVNHKGVIDVDTVKGCTFGMRAYPGTGCYGECYANKIANQYGIKFEVTVKRGFIDHWEHRDRIIRELLNQPATWYRIGTMGEPCHAWAHTIRVIKSLRPSRKTAVIISKLWVPLSDDHLSKLLDLDVVMNVSVSGLDTDEELAPRVAQIERMRKAGLNTVARVVSCNFGTSEWARAANAKQQFLMTLVPVIDNPLRAGSSNPRVISGDILVEKRPDSIGGGKLVSLHAPGVHLGHCSECTEQCGVVGAFNSTIDKGEAVGQAELFAAVKIKKPKTNAVNVEFRYVKTVIGSGFEADVAALAIEDGIAHRAARKNMQIHSAIILLVEEAFAGFMTFQVNETIGEFCMLQSVIRPDLHTDELYRLMVKEALLHNEHGFPALMTTNPKSKFETPKMFESLGFVTYLKMSGFEYMLLGDLAYARMKILAHITMTNVWNSVKGDWLRLKKEWNENIEKAGVDKGVPNPTFATREGCWQGESGFANVVTGRSHNGNASVLDPVACEVILRFFMPKNGRRVYNPFGGGVQFGFVTGASGYEYLASEIRKNQCDANNALCSQFPGVRWEQGDSSTFTPDGTYDLVFTCPPYYRVEKYIDYDGASPDGEINSLPTYGEFRDTLFAGYAKAIEHLRDNGFIVVMTGDSRDKNGGYHCHEAETEVFFKSQGLSVYNKIVYLEAEFTRLAQAKKTLNMRKFPKREQKIIVAYKGKVDAIKDEFAPIGRL